MILRLRWITVIAIYLTSIPIIPMSWTGKKDYVFIYLRYLRFWTVVYIHFEIELYKMLIALSVLILLGFLVRFHYSKYVSDFVRYLVLMSKIPGPRGFPLIGNLPEFLCDEGKVLEIQYVMNCVVKTQNEIYINFSISASS